VSRYDAIVVGGGHNGLVAAFDLSRAGIKTLVLERRPMVGGACVTEEFLPGYHASTGAYVLSMLGEGIWRDMRLVERGIVVDAAGPTLNIAPDNAHFYIHDDIEATVAEVARISPHDADALPPFEAHLARLARLVSPMFHWTPVEPRLRRLSDLAGLTQAALHLARFRALVPEVAFLLTTSASQFLDERFESAIVKAALGWHAINDSLAGPSTPGTAYVLLHDHASVELGGGVREWGFVRGGMGQLTKTMADAVREAGGEIRLNAEVARITTRLGAAKGVVLESGEEIPSRIVVSNADPKRTFLGLVDRVDLPPEFVAALGAYRSDGTSIKINLAVGELPRFVGIPGDGVQPYHTGIMEIGPSLAVLDQQQQAARAGVPGTGTHIELCIPTVHDPSLAPPGKHIITIDVNSQPYTLREGNWDDLKEGVSDRVIGELGIHFPNLPGSIEGRSVLSPLDLERQLYLTGGHALHGDMLIDQLYFLRPVRGYGSYRTPVHNLYLCGAGTHPGGGVSGANGRNAVRQIRRDLTTRRLRLS
jgi:phytoene dehydrogenase-like protein